MWTCVSCAPGDAPYCTPELYKECAHPALGENETALYASSVKENQCVRAWQFWVKVTEMFELCPRQISWWRETTTSACARRRATWPATTKSCPSSRSPARPPLNTWRRSTTSRSSTSSKDQDLKTSTGYNVEKQCRPPKVSFCLSSFKLKWHQITQINRYYTCMCHLSMHKLYTM